MGPGWMQILVVAILVLLLFGRGKIAALMQDVAQGIKSFRKGLEESPSEEETPSLAPKDKRDAPPAPSAPDSPSESRRPASRRSDPKDAP